MNISIGNIRHLSNTPSTTFIKADRSSVLGNPFHMSHEYERDAVCDAFDEYFSSVMNREDPDITSIADKYKVSLSPVYKGSPSSIRSYISSLSRYQDITLLCWCYPKRCHTSSIKDYLLSNYH